MLFSPSCISGKPFTKTIYKTQMSWAEKILWQDHELWIQILHPALAC